MLTERKKSMETKASNRYHEQLTSDNAALLLIDHQVGLFTGVRDIPVAELKHNVVGLAKAARVLGVPPIVTATSPDLWSPIIPELTQALHGVPIIARTTVNAFDDDRFAKAVEAAGRKKLIIAGVSIEVCLAFPAIHATAAGYDAYAVIDASGTFSETKRVTGLLRMVQAGVIVTDYATVAVEMLKDNASPKAGDLYAALDMPFAGLVGQLAGAFASKHQLRVTTRFSAGVRLTGIRLPRISTCGLCRVIVGHPALWVFNARPHRFYPRELGPDKSLR
jgi:nicotinamidase-related amidase